MQFDSNLQPKEYASALKNRMESIFHFGSERFTGFICGRFFRVTHHCEYEWNRRITSESNTAVGYIRKTMSGSSIHCVTFKGMLAPHIIISNILFYVLFVYFYLSFYEIDIRPVFLPIVGVICGAVIFVAWVSAFSESLTENSYRGAKEVAALLYDPTDLFSLQNNYNELP